MVVVGQTDYGCYLSTLRLPHHKTALSESKAVGIGDNFRVRNQSMDLCWLGLTTREDDFPVMWDVTDDAVIHFNPPVFWFRSNWKIGAVW